MSPEPFIDEGFAERWAAWQARGAANDRATKRRFFIVAAMAILSGALLSGIWWF